MIERDDDGEILFFKVSNTSPYQFVSAAPRVGGGNPAPVGEAALTMSAPSSAPSPADVTANPPELPDLRPFRSMIFYMAKVAVIAVVVIGVFGLLRKYLF